MADSAAPSAGRVFISYRREETAYAAGWLFDRLVDRFGRGQIFKDIDSIQLGDDFVEVITTAVASCDVLLALIGEQWLTITDEHGRARLDNPDDFLRLELEAALTRDVRVIPILVAGARMPRADQLPPSLAKLVRRHALELSPSHFEFDTSRLLSVINSTLAGAATRARREAEEQARRDAQEQARRDAQEQARRDAEEQARRDAQEQARRDAQERTRREAEEQARRDAQEQARRDAQEQARRDAEEQARRDAQERARHDAEERARHDAEDHARRDAQEQARDTSVWPVADVSLVRHGRRGAAGLVALAVAVATIIGIVIANLVGHNGTTSQTSTAAGTTSQTSTASGTTQQTYAAPGGISVRTDKGWTLDGPADIPNVRDYRAPDAANKTTGTYFRIGIGDANPTSSLADVLKTSTDFLTGPSSPYQNVTINHHITIETCGAPSVGIDFTGVKDGVLRRAVERLMLSGGITKILEVNMPDREWDSTHTLLNQLIESCHIG